MLNIIILNLKQMEMHQGNSSPLTATNFKRQMRNLTNPYKEKIAEASKNLKKKFMQYKTGYFQKKSVQLDHAFTVQRQKTPSLLSEYSYQYQQDENVKKDTIITEPNEAKSYQLREWNASNESGFRDVDALSRHYNQIFTKRKIMLKNRKNCYDFKQDQKQLLVKIFKQIKSQDNYVSFQNVIEFFSKCKLFYLYYNIKPNHLSDILKDSAHQFKDKVSLIEFLNIFVVDRPNITGYQDVGSALINKRCILSEQSWKQLKKIFSTLDTFGNETIYIAPFIYKIKNNHSNRALINQPAIEYPEIKRSIPIKKVIFNIEFRYQIEGKIQWRDIQNLFHNFVYREQPTIDIIYRRMVERGDINKFSNYFMLSPLLIEEIKNIYYRCPKYCEYFVKTKFICKQIVDSLNIKKYLKEAIVRIVEVGAKSHYIRLQDQIRMLSNQAESYIDLDQLLQYFSIKGPINTTASAQIQFQQSQSCDEENQLRLKLLSRAKSLQKIKQYGKKQVKAYKPLRHLTVCEQFKLTQKAGETIMQRKTREWRQKQLMEQEMQLKKQFKASPIPAELNQERYKAYLKKMQDEKQIKKQQSDKRKREEERKIYQYLKTNTSLFNKRQVPNAQRFQQNYSFSPKPLPWYVTQIYMLDKIVEGKTLRKKKIQTEARLRVMREWKKLPDMIKQFTDPSELDELQQQQFSEKAMQQKNRSKVKEVPDFKELQRQFAEQLQRRKRETKPTVPVQFKFSSSKVKSRAQERALSAVKSAAALKRSSLVQHKSSVQTCIVQPKIQIPTTIKYQQMVNFTHQRLNEQLVGMERALSEERQRLSKQKNFARYMRTKLKQSLRKSGSLHELVQSKTKKLRREWRQLQKENEEDLCRMYSNVMSRPFLFERGAEVGKAGGVGKTGYGQVDVAAQQGNTAKPLKKRNRKQIEKVNHKISKHVHQSPLKELQPELFDSTSKKKMSPDKQLYELYQSQQQSHPNLNRSF